MVACVRGNVSLRKLKLTHFSAACSLLVLLNIKMKLKLRRSIRQMTSDICVRGGREVRREALVAQDQEAEENCC